MRRRSETGEGSVYRYGPSEAFTPPEKKLNDIEVGQKGSLKRKNARSVSCLRKLIHGRTGKRQSEEKR